MTLIVVIVVVVVVVVLGLDHLRDFTAAQRAQFRGEAGSAAHAENLLEKEVG